MGKIIVHKKRDWGKNCLLQDYDQARKMPGKCPVCGSKNVELIIEDE